MLNLLCATEGIGWTVALIALLGLMVVYLVMGTINRKKTQDQVVKMINELKKGDKVVTNAGVYGEVVSLRETNMGKVVVLKTGHDDGDKNASYLTLNASVILGIDKKEDLILDKDGNVIDPSDLKTEVLTEKAEKTEKIVAKKPRATAKKAETSVEKPAEKPATTKKTPAKTTKPKTSK